MVDRILQAISPALALEIERIVEETRQDVATRFADRLQLAETDRHDAVERAIGETRESIREELTAQLTTALQAQFIEKLALTEREHNRVAEEWRLERERLKQENEELRAFVEAQSQLADARSQSEMLIRFLKLTEPFATSLAFYTTRGDSLGLWKSRGETAFPEFISAPAMDPEAYFKPVIVRDRTVAAVCARPPFRIESLDSLVSALERAILIFGAKLRAPAAAPDTPEMARSSQKF